MKRVLPRFVDWWMKMLWDAMQRTGKGYRQPGFKFVSGDQRRKDKLAGLESNKHMRGYRARYL